MRKPLIPYVRQSQKKEETISIDEQIRSIEMWAAAHDVALAEPVIEQGVSGNSYLFHSHTTPESGSAFKSAEACRQKAIDLSERLMELIRK